MAAPPGTRLIAPCYLHLPGRRLNLSPGKAPGNSPPPTPTFHTSSFFCTSESLSVGDKGKKGKVSTNCCLKSKLALRFGLRIKSKRCCWSTRCYRTWGSSPPFSPLLICSSLTGLPSPCSHRVFPEPGLCPCCPLCSEHPFLDLPGAGFHSDITSETLILFPFPISAYWFV